MMATNNNQMARTTNNFKVVLLGEGCVGKSSIVLRYVEDKFNTQHISTLQASFLNKKLTLDDGSCAFLNIWDTAGQERFHALGPIYYRGSHGAILVYDITDQDSFLKVKNWVKELKRMLSADVVISIVGNKIDLEDHRTVVSEEAQQYAHSVGAHYHECSAKDDIGIDELFGTLTTLMAQRHAQRVQETNAVRLQHGTRANQLIVEDLTNDAAEQLQNQQENRACCSIV